MAKAKKPKTEAPTSQERRVYRYWQNCINRAIKAQPTNLWEKAEKRYSAKEGETDDAERPFVNDCRKHHEASMSFLDQQEPSANSPCTKTTFFVFGDVWVLATRLSKGRAALAATAPISVQWGAS